MTGQPGHPPNVLNPQEKGFRGQKLRETQWLIGPDHKAGYFQGGGGVGVRFGEGVG